MVTQERLKQLLDYDPETGEFVWINPPVGWLQPGDRTGASHDRDGYLRIGIDGRRYKAHRLAWLFVHGVWPAGEIDHINRVKHDNRISNLRDATVGENRQNITARRTNTSGAKGVSWHKHSMKWRACIRSNGRQISLGYYCSFDAAVAARQRAEKALQPFSPIMTEQTG